MRAGRTRLLGEPLRVPAGGGRLWGCVEAAGRRAPVFRQLGHGLGRVGETPLELADALPHGGPDLREPLGPEDQEHHEQDDNDFGEAEITHTILVRSARRATWRSGTPAPPRSGS